MKKLILVLLLMVAMFFTKAQINTSIVSTNDILQHFQFLASDAMKGRYSGTKESLIAAEYIRNQFKSAGLTLMFDNGLQHFDMTSKMVPGKNNSLRLNNTSFKYGKDFLTYSFSSNDTLSAQLVFAGYGLNVRKDSLVWKDYKDIDVKNKWVMIFTGDPGSDTEKNPWHKYASERSKVLQAHDLGAAGVIIVMSAKDYPADKLEGDIVDLGYNTVDIPSIRITRKMADILLKSKNLTITALESELKQSMKPHSCDLGITVTASTDLQRTRVDTRNVVAMQPGSDSSLKNEYIVIGAHYDHLGVIADASDLKKSPQKKIHYGADDNASGTIGLIELAKLLAADKNNIKRSIIFIAFDGEEEGLLGSNYFVSHLPVDKKKIRLMINFDMIGRLNVEQKLLIVNGTGSFIESDSILHLYSNSSGLKVKLSAGSFSGSDQFSFYSEKIPVLFFFTGVHEDYHTPNDVISKINLEGEKLVIAYAANVIEDFANTNAKLKFKEDGADQNGSPRRYKVTMGVIPDFIYSEQNGFKIDGAKKESPAEKAGMIKGDLIQAIDGKVVNSIQDYMQRMENVEPGQTIEVEFIRNNVKQKVSVTFEIKKL